MADNTQLNVMSGGDIIQTEDFGTSGKIQRIKLVLGNKDVDGGDVSSTNALPTNDSSLNTVQGTTADAAVTGDVTGTISAKLRGLSKIFNSVWDSVNSALKVSLYIGGTALQQSGGNLLVNVQNFGVGQFSNQDGNAATTTSALTMNQNQVFNGSTWDRLRGDSTNGAYVQIKNTPTVATNADIQNAGGAPSRGILVAGWDNANARFLSTDTTGKAYALSIPTAATSGGATPYSLVSAATTNATNVKASAGQVYSIQCFNLNASPRYLKFYDKASAPTVGTDTPVKRIMIPGNTTGAGATITISVGTKFSNGIAFAITGGITDADTTAISASEVLVNIDYN